MYYYLIWLVAMALFQQSLCSEKAAHAPEKYKIQHSLKVNHIAKRAIIEAGEYSVVTKPAILYKKKNIALMHP